MRTTYCLPIDAARKFDPEIDQGDLLADGYLGDVGHELVSSRIEEIEDDFDETTGNPQRLTHSGHGPNAFEYKSASLTRYQGGMRLFLDHRNVLPIDTAEGDKIEVKKGRDDWRDVTGKTDLWRLNHPEGSMQFFGVHKFVNSPYKGSMRDDNIRIKYRYGAFGGKRGRAGQTSLSAQLEPDDTAVEVENADRLPNRATILVGNEYVRYNSVDRANDQLKDISRGMRRTTESQHDSGSVVHYCSMNVRSAIAAMAAVEMRRYEDYVDQLVETSSNDNLSARDKIEQWEAEYEKALGRYSEVVML